MKWRHEVVIVGFTWVEIQQQASLQKPSMECQAGARTRCCPDSSPCWRWCSAASLCLLSSRRRSRAASLSALPGAFCFLCFTSWCFFLLLGWRWSLREPSLPALKAGSWLCSLASSASEGSVDPSLTYHGCSAVKHFQLSEWPRPSLAAFQGSMDT